MTNEIETITDTVYTKDEVFEEFTVPGDPWLRVDDDFDTVLGINDPENVNSGPKVFVKLSTIMDGEIAANGRINIDGSVSFNRSFKPMIDAFKADTLTLLTKLSKITFD